MTDGFARRKLLGMLSGSFLAQSCYVLAKLGLPDLLAGGPRTAGELAELSGVDAAVLGRLLRALAATGVLKQTEAGGYALTSVSELLRTDAQDSLRQTAILHGEEIFQSFAEIMHTVRTGVPAFEKVHGQPFYAYLADHPEVAATFAQAMGSARTPSALSTCELPDDGMLVDVGGGNGGLLASVLTERPALRGTLVELPESIASARHTLADAGVSDRVELVEGSFFEHVPAGGDVYVLSRVLHNWTDEHAQLILRGVRAAMAPGARLLVLEELLPEPGEPQGSAAAGMVDLLMIVMMEGHDRTEAEYRELLAGAGFEVRHVHRASGASTESAIEGVASGSEAGCGLPNRTSGERDASQPQVRDQPDSPFPT